MEKKKKALPGPGGRSIIVPKLVKSFSQAEREFIIQEYLSTGISKQEIWKKYTGKSDHGRLLDWMRKLGYTSVIQKVDKLESPSHTMQQQVKKLSNQQEAIEANQQKLGEREKELEATILVLEKKLKLSNQALEEEKIRAIAYSTMIDIAEKEFSIPIRKKPSTKP